MRKIGTLCVYLCAGFILPAIAETESQTPYTANITDTGVTPLSFSGQDQFKTALLAAKDALKSGLPSLAQAIAEDILQKTTPPSETESELKEIYIDSLIAQGKFELADRQLPLLKSKPDSEKNNIRRALIAIGLGNAQEADAFLKDIDEYALDAENAAWYHLAKGYAFYESSNLPEALKEFQKAKDISISEYTLTDIEIAFNIVKLSDGMENVNLEELEKDLAGKVILYLGTPAGFQFAKQYAAVLFKLGRPEDALEVINQQLDIELAQESDKDELRIISAAMTRNPERQQALLREILRQTSSTGVAEFALALMTKNSEVTDANLEKSLAEILENGSEKIRDRVLLEIAKVALKSKNIKTASTAANRLIEEFPASRYKIDALRILAWTAFSSDEGKTPEYRLAASHLLAIADLEKTPKRANKTRLLAADCFYLNKDYANAAKIYSELFSTDNENRGITLNKAIESYLQMDNEEDAVTLLDSAYAFKLASDDELWNAEWKIINSYNKSGETDKATERVERAIKNSANLSESLKLRMLWLKARMSEDSGEYAQTEILCDEILHRLDIYGGEKNEIIDVIGANTLLMKARCQEHENKTEDAFESYAELRKRYPKSDAAQLSYLYQARLEASMGRYTQAQQLCNTLADIHPDSPHVYSALFDSAQYARQAGTETNLKSALATLNKLCNAFPNDPRNFYARIAQAEILRRLNAFADARALYNEIINKYSAHPEIYIAWMGLGDSTQAQPNKSLDAAAIFERLYSLPDMPEAAKAEAASKWAFALRRADRKREADEVLWTTSSRFLENENLDAVARYWVGRSLYTLAGWLKESDNMRDARAAYELIVKYKLPSYSAVEKSLNIKEENHE